MGAIQAAESAIAGIGLATSLIGRNNQEAAQQQAIDLRLKQEESANIQRSTQRARRLNEVMAAQVAREGASGLAASSQSFFAVGRDSFNQFSEDENADALNLSFDKLAASQQSKSIKEQENIGMFGDLFSAGNAIFNSHVFKASPQNQPVFQSQNQQQQNQYNPAINDIFKNTSLDSIL